MWLWVWCSLLSLPLAVTFFFHLCSSLTHFPKILFQSLMSQRSPRVTELVKHRFPLPVVAWPKPTLPSLKIIFFFFYNVVLVSSIKQHKAAIILHTSSPSLGSLLSPILSLSVITDWAPCATQQRLTSCPSCTRECVCWCYFLHSSHCLPPRLCPQIHSLHLHLPSFSITFSKVPCFQKFLKCFV